ncbi:MAG: sensor histidine kinase, partial [Termitinemataceae bacterium]
TELGSLSQSFLNLIEALQDTLASLKASLHEKDILLREVHHRVKNNLQVISSMINLEADEFLDEKIRQVLFELQEKVYAMSMVHETVYSSASFSAIPMSLYLDKLAESLSSYHSLQIPIAIHIDADDVQLNLERAIPCALIIVELVTNAFKYAFSGKPEGLITVSLKEEGSEYSLSVRDNGVGFKSHTTQKIEKTGGIGSLIVEALCSQLKGTLHLETGPQGTCIEIRFPQ